MADDFEDFFAAVGEAPKRLCMDKKEKWALKLFSQWTSQQSYSAHCPSIASKPNLGTIEDKTELQDYHALLLESNYEELDAILSRFIIDINNQRMGKRLYSPETIRQLVMSLQRFLRSNGRHVSLLTDPTFSQLQNCVALESFEVFSDQSPQCKYNSIISYEMEQDLWTKGFLGTTDAHSLLSALVYLVGVTFGVVTGGQLRKCSYKNGPIQIVSESGIDHIRYFPPKLKKKSTEDTCLSGHLDIHKEFGPGDRCLTSVFKLYQQKCPHDRPGDTLFLKPLHKPTENTWYSNQPLGKDALSKIWKTLSEVSQVTIDSATVSATCAIRHFNRGMNETLVKSMTGINKADVDHLLQSNTEIPQCQLPALEVSSKHIRKKRLVEDADLDNESQALALVRRCQQAYMPSVPVLQERLLSDILPTKLLTAGLVDNIYLRDGSGPSGKDLRYYGFITDFLQEVASELNIPYDMRFISPRTYGKQNERGQWSGLIGDVTKGECHVACAPLTITSTRTEVVDFTVPFATTTLSILYKKPRRGEPLPFTNLRQLVESDVNVGVGLLGHGDMIRCLRESRNPLLQKLLEKVVSTGHQAFTSHFTEGIRQVLKGNFAFLLMRDSAQLFVNIYPDDFILIDTNMMQKHYGLALAKGSVLTRPLNKAVLKLTESGFVDSLYEKWWEVDSDPNTKQLFQNIIKGNEDKLMES